MSIKDQIDQLINQHLIDDAKKILDNTFRNDDMSIEEYLKFDRMMFAIRHN